MTLEAIVSNSAGLIGLHRIQQQGLIAKVKPLLLDLKSVGFHVSTSLYTQALQLAEEAED